MATINDVFGHLLVVNADGSINVDIVGETIAPVTGTGTQTGNTSVTLALTGQASVDFQIVPTGFTGTINFEASYDSGVTWNPLVVWPLGVTPLGNSITSLALANSSAEVVYQGVIAGATNVRARVSGFAGGSVVTTIIATALPTVLTASGVTRIEDGVGTTLASVGVTHTGDNQVPSATAGSLSTAGPTQITNASQNLDRLRETSADAQGALGIQAGAMQTAAPVTLGPVTSGAITGSTNPQTITLTNGTGTLGGGSANGGLDWQLFANMVVVLDVGKVTQEAFVATAVNVGAKTVTGVIRNNHGANATATSFLYNQGRDALAPDGANGAGMALGATALFNTALNGGSGGWERERSAAGELDGASGTGTAIAAEYEFNGGGPITNAPAPSGLQFDRARNLQAQGFGSGTLANNPLAAGATSLTLNAPPTNGTLLAGQQLVLDRAGANPEAAYVASSYVAGSATVPLQSATAFQHAQNATVEWGQFAALGPQLSGFLPTGIGIEEEALWDPVSQKFYIERAHTQDGINLQNVVSEGVILNNGAGVATGGDRLKSAGATGVAAVGGAAATAAAIAGNPVLVGGRDAAGNALPASVTAAGAAGNSGLVVQGIAGGVAVPVSGTTTAKPAASVYPNAPTNVTAANADTALAAANASRTGLIISSDSTAKLYVLVDVGGAGAASATNFSFVVQPGSTLELPLVGGSVPTARIRGFWSSANGSAGVTDIS